MAVSTHYNCPHSPFHEEAIPALASRRMPQWINKESMAPTIIRQFAHEDGKVVSPTPWPPLGPRDDPWYSFLLEAESVS